MKRISMLFVAVASFFCVYAQDSSTVGTDESKLYAGYELGYNFLFAKEKSYDFIRSDMPNSYGHPSSVSTRVFQPFTASPSG